MNQEVDKVEPAIVVCRDMIYKLGLGRLPKNKVVNYLKSYWGGVIWMKLIQVLVIDWL